MHVHKPADAMLLLGYQSRGGQSSLAVTVGYCRGIDGTQVSEQDAWKSLTAIFTDEPFDLSQKKFRRGYGVAGAAMAPQGKPVTGLTVRAGVGTLQKSVLVLGDRYWTRGIAGWQASAPQPFTDMPIGLSRAYGSKPFTANPHGRGHSADADKADGMPLPNIESPNAPVLRPADVPQPATLGVLAQSDPSQTRWLGTLDQRWQRERLPWLPDDTDPRWFDRFPQDQCQDGYWRGDESWFAENMNAGSPVQRGALPALRPRLLARNDAAPERRFELPLDLDTVWLLPNDGRVLVLYRAELATRREDAEDVLGLGIFTERMAEPAQPVDHWARVWQQADEEQLKPAPATAPAAPPEAAAKSAAAAAEIEGYGKAAVAHRSAVAKTLADSRQSALAEAEQTMQRHGFGSLQGRPPKDGYPVDASSLPLPPAWPKEPAAFKAAVKQYVADSLAAGEAENRKQWKAYGLDYDAAVARSKAQPAAVLDPAEAITKSRLPAPQKAALLEQYKAFQIKMDAVQLKAADISKQAKAVQEQADAPPVLPLPDEALPQGPRTALDREALLQRHAKRESARWTELQELDLAGVDLSGLDLNTSVLRKCNLRGANLEGVDFTECQFEECDFGDARLGNARFTRAQLKACQAAGAVLSGADFTHARLEKCVFTQADLSGTQWLQSQFKECDLGKANLRQAQGREANFTACSLAGADASEATFPRATFSKSVLEGATLDGASLEGATLLTCQAAGSRFDGARLAGLRTLKGTDLRKANLNRAHMDKASLQDTDLGNATLRETRLDRGFLKNCDLTGTDAWHLVARTCDFTGSRIAQASWRGANLMKARLRQVVLQDVDLTGANLHAADTRTANAQGVRLEQALLTRCRLPEDYGRE